MSNQHVLPPLGLPHNINWQSAFDCLAASLKIICAEWGLCISVVEDAATLRQIAI
jgi:hypothetical protein